MSDGQTEACESIQQQNATPVSIKLERGESVKWHDGRQWRVGYVLLDDGRRVYHGRDTLVGTTTGIYKVAPESLQPYGPRCEACDGTGKRLRQDEGKWIGGCVGKDGRYHYQPASIDCSQCGGSGRLVSMTTLHGAFEGRMSGGIYHTTCPTCQGSGRKQ